MKAYQLLTQTYSLDCLNDGGESLIDREENDVPAAEVVPYIWSADNPMEEASRAVAAHKLEEQRLSEARVVFEELPNSMLGIPVGFPVQLQESLKPKVRNSTTSEGWISCLRCLTEAPAVLPGGGAGDICIVTAYGHGNYRVALLSKSLNNSLSWTNQGFVEKSCLKALANQSKKVTATALKPSFTTSASPRACASWLLSRHEDELARLGYQKSSYA